MKVLITILMLLATLTASEQYSYATASQLANALQLAVNDVNQTAYYVNDCKTDKENNPIVAPVVNAGNGVYKTASLAAIGACIIRANALKDSDRPMELFIWQVVEAGALSYSGEPWSISYAVSW